VDAQTGQPVQGAEVCVLSRYFVLVPVETADRQYLKTVHGRTDSRGRFSLPAVSLTQSWREAREQDYDFPLVVALDLILVKRLNAVEILVYAPDHVTAFHADPRGLPLDWRRNDRRSMLRIPLWGYRYTLRLKRVKDRAEWEEKCSRTISAAFRVSRDITDEWVFQDLSRYLQQWPQGEKAREFYTRLWNTTSFAYWPCEDMRAEFASGRLSGSELTLYWERGSKILSLARDFSSPPGGMDRSAFERGLANHEASLLCAKDLLDSKDRD
jgi:hypothetical protein